MSIDVRMSDFCRNRQHSRSSLSWSEDMDGLTEQVRANWHRARSTYRRQAEGTRPLLHGGVVEVPVSPEGVWTPIVPLKDGDILSGKYSPRVPGEHPRQSYSKLGAHSKAQSATAICYHRDVLAETETKEPGDYWEIIALNASPYPEGIVIPIDPWTLCHNHFQTDGGTASGMSPVEFEETLRASFLFWKDHIKVSV